MEPEKKLISQWANDINIQLYTSSFRNLEINNYLTESVTAGEFLSKLNTIEFSYQDRKVFNRKIKRLARKYKLDKHFYKNLLNINVDNHVKFKEDGRFILGKVAKIYGGSGDGNIVEVDVWENGKCNTFRVKESDIKFATKREIAKIKKHQTN